MATGSILDEIIFDKDTGTIRTVAWSFTRERAVEKALNRIDLKARSMGRNYSILEEPTQAFPDPANPSDIWRCDMKALLI